MGLRCLIGHDFGPPETVRNRDQRGGEVVVTVREFKECRRCGEQQVISENKEVRAESATEEPTGGTNRDQPDSVALTGQSADEYREMSAEEDDGIILEDEPATEPGRGHGEWPDLPTREEAATGDEVREWPTVDGEDEGFAAGPSTGGPADAVDFKGGLTPEQDPSTDVADDQEDAEILDDDQDEREFQRGGEVAAEPQHTGSREFAEGEAGGASVSQQHREPDSTLFCPVCEHTTPAQGGSLRSGDICPECHRGYLAEQ